MNWAHDLLEFPVVRQIGRALLHSLWEGVAIAAILWLALTLLRSRGATARYLTACAAMLMMAAAPLVTMMLLPSAPRPQALEIPQATPHEAMAGEATAMPTAGHAGGRASRAVTEPPTPERDAVALAGLTARSADAVALVSATPVHARPSLWQRASDWTSRSAPWLALCWIAGVLAMSLWNLGAWTATQRLKLSRTQPIGPEIQAVAARLANRLGLDRAVRILQSALIDSPLVIGAIKPVILLPASMLTDLPVAHLEALLAHELAHVLRHDYLVNLLQAVVETLLFYHPAVWWISSRIRAERENCCDDLAISVTRDRASYVRALARVAGAMGPTLAPAASGGELLPRLRRVLGKPDSDAAGSRWIAGAALLSVCAGLVVFVTAHKVIAQDAAQKPASPATTQPSTSTARTLEITVVDQQTKRPLAGAGVGRYTSAGRASSNTDAAGKVSIPLPDGTDFMNLTVRTDAYVPTMVLWNQKAPIPASFTVPIEPGSTIGGKVVDEQGQPIADASVGLWIQPKNIPTEPPSGTPFMQIYDLVVKTGADGKWTCDFAPKEFSSVSLRLVHPDFVPDDLYGRSSKATPQEFHNQTAMAVMKRGTKLAGRVVDEEGKPIAGAIVSLGGRTMGVKSPTTQSADDGTFVLAHCEPGVRAPLIVTAKNHASTMSEVVVDKEIAGLEVKLANPKPLIVQVVDAKGSPVADTRVMLKRWRGLDSIDWEAHTDADGKATWIEAPLEGATFAFSHPGFMYQNNHSLVSGDGPQIVSLLPQLKVIASILDDATGQPIPKFKVVKGYLSGRDRIFWEQGARNGMVEGANGKFEMLENDDRDGYAIRIEADGYLPAESKIYHMADGEVRFDFRLKKSADISGTLVSEDDKPLAGVQVLAVVPGVQIHVEDGRIGNGTFAQKTTADDAGHFRLPPQKGKFLIMVVDDRAYALLTPRQLGGSNRWIIPPWGSVHGTASIGSKPAAGHTITAHSQILNEGASKDSIDEDFGSVSLRCSTPVDSTGHFLLTRVSPGSVYVGILVQWGESRSRLSMSGQTQVTRLDIEAGKTTPLTLGGTGRAVVGRVVVPSSLKEQVDWNHGFFNISSRLHLPGRALPADWDKLNAEQRARWNEQWRNSPEVKAYEKELENRKSYPVVIGPDGTFRVEDIAAGSYTLNITAEKATGQPGTLRIETIATATQEFTVPPMPTGRSDEPLDVGTIGLAEKTGAKLNEAAPALEAKTVDGKPFSLADYRGKFVLIDFWATWCGPCVEEMPYLKATYEAFAKDSRFAMISLSLDERIESPRQFAANQGLKWTQGFLGDWSTSDIPSKWGVQGIPAVFLIGPDGKVLETGLRGNAIQAAVTRALGAPVAQ